MSDWDHFRHFMASVVGWFTTSANWTGSSGIPYLFLRQAELSLAVVLGALVVGGASASYSATPAAAAWWR